MIEGIDHAIYGFARAIGYPHPVHPPVTHLPIGLVFGALLLGFASLALRHPAMGRAARYCAFLALCFAIPAVFLGYLDWQHAFAGGGLWPVRIKIGLAGLLLAGLSWALAIGRDAEGAKGRVVLLYFCCLLIVIGLGYFGGQLVYAGRVPAGGVRFAAGERVFGDNCGGCHPYGGNAFDPSAPLRGAPQLSDVPSFLRWIRDPRRSDGSRGPMPPFPPSRISDGQAESLRDYLVNVVEGRTEGAQGALPIPQIVARTDAASIEKGHQLFEAYCSDCHTVTSTKTVVGPGLQGILKGPRLPVSGRPAVPENIYRQLRRPYKNMPSFAQKLTDEDVFDLIAFLAGR
jgi:mono/diheme cytochrome c family protein/uncharacterized membrane protein